MAGGGDMRKRRVLPTCVCLGDAGTADMSMLFITQRPAGCKVLVSNGQLGVCAHLLALPMLLVSRRPLPVLCDLLSAAAEG